MTWRRTPGHGSAVGWGPSVRSPSPWRCSRSWSARSGSRVRWPWRSWPWSPSAPGCGGALARPVRTPNRTPRDGRRRAGRRSARSAWPPGVPRRRADDRPRSSRRSRPPASRWRRRSPRGSRAPGGSAMTAGSVRTRSSDPRGRVRHRHWCRGRRRRDRSGPAPSARAEPLPRPVPRRGERRRPLATWTRRRILPHGGGPGPRRRPRFRSRRLRGVVLRASARPARHRHPGRPSPEPRLGCRRIPGRPPGGGAHGGQSRPRVRGRSDRLT